MTGKTILLFTIVYFGIFILDLRYLILKHNLGYFASLFSLVMNFLPHLFTGGECSVCTTAYLRRTLH